MGSLFNELRRRNVFQVGATYVVLSWLILQVASELAPILQLPDQAVSYVFFALILGFPMALFLAWAYELTPDGVKRAEDVTDEDTAANNSGWRRYGLLVGLLVLIITGLLVERFLADSAANTGATGESLPGNIPDVTTNPEPGQANYDSIAVLPFANMSDDTEQRYFSDGISEEILNLLARTKGLSVAARTSSFALRDEQLDIRTIGEKLGVQTVLEGSVRNSGNRLRITAQLIDAASGYHLWSDAYDRELDDVFAIQDEIAGAIVAALSPRFNLATNATNTASAPKNLQAWEAYRRGFALLDKRTTADITNADIAFKLALDIDPNAAEAWAGRAYATILLSDRGGSYGNTPADYAISIADTFVARALALNPALPEALVVKGYLLWESGQLEESLTLTEQALDIRPSYPDGLKRLTFPLGSLGRISDARHALEKAHKLDPLSESVIQNLFDDYWHSGNKPRMQMLIEHARKNMPHRIDLLNQFEGQLAIRNGNFVDGIRKLGTAAEIRNIDFSRFRVNLFCLWLNAKQCMIENRFSDLPFFITLLRGEREEAKRFTNFAPVNPLLAGSYLSSMTKHLLQDELAEAAALFAQINPTNDLSATSPIFRSSFWGTPLYNSWLQLQQRLDNKENFDKGIAALTDYTTYLRAQGLHAAADYPAAIHAAQTGKPEIAISHLRNARKTGFLRWWYRTDVLLSPLHDNPDFIALFDELDAHLAAQRAELGYTD